MRIKKDEMLKREAFVRDFKANNHTAGLSDVQTALKKEFGTGMTPSRLSDLLKRINGSHHKVNLVKADDDSDMEATAEPMTPEHTPRTNGGTAGEMAKRKPGRPRNQARKGIDVEEEAQQLTPDMEAEALDECRQILREKAGAEDIHITYTVKRDLKY